MMQTILSPPVSSPTKRDFRSLLNRFHLGPRGAKVTVIVVFTLCWLLVGLARTNVSRDLAGFEGSSLMALATSLQQGAVSGRDFQSTFGPATQFLAWIATSITKGGWSLGADGMIVFFVWRVTAVPM